MTIPQATQPTKKNTKKLAAALILTVVVVVATCSVYGLLANTPSTQNAENAQNNSNTSTNPQSWMTKGVYATYEGQASILSIPITFKARMEVVDTNQTHAQISTYINMSTPYGSTENTTTTWVNLSNMTFQPDGLTLNNTYTTQVTTSKIGTRTCTVYEYKNQDISATYYVDDTYHWPIKMTITSPVVDGQSYNMGVSLVDSNIPGL